MTINKEPRRAALCVRVSTAAAGLMLVLVFGVAARAAHAKRYEFCRASIAKQAQAYYDNPENCPVSSADGCYPNTFYNDDLNHCLRTGKATLTKTTTPLHKMTDKELCKMWKPYNEQCQRRPDVVAVCEDRDRQQKILMARHPSWNPITSTSCP